VICRCPRDSLFKKIKTKPVLGSSPKQQGCVAVFRVAASRDSEWLMESPAGAVAPPGRALSCILPLHRVIERLP
jgi:hypothetical protein